MSARPTSTGRKPSVDLSRLETLLTSYFSESHPSVAELATEVSLTEATVRKYLKLALGSLPRGRAAALPREARNIQALLNGVPTEALLGTGRTELLLRRRSAGDSLTALATQFGISRDRVSKLCRAHEPETEVAEASAEATPEPETTGEA